MNKKICKGHGCYCTFLLRVPDDLSALSQGYPGSPGGPGDIGLQGASVSVTCTLSPGGLLQTGEGTGPGSRVPGPGSRVWP